MYFYSDHAQTTRGVVSIAGDCEEKRKADFS